MRLLLQPRSYPIYGQDFYNRLLSDRCQLTIATKTTGHYKWDGPLSLVVSQNPDDDADSQFISEVGDNVPVVAHVHTRWGYLNSRQQECMLRTLSKTTLGIAPSSFLKTDMDNRFPNVEWHLVRNGIDTKVFFPCSSAERTSFKKGHGIDPGSKIIGYVGRLDNAKGLQILEQIVASMTGDDFHLFIQYPQWPAVPHRMRTKYAKIAQRLRSQCLRAVVPWGDDDPQSLHRPVRFFDALLSPSLSEVQPLVAIQALACGVPVLATRSTPFYEELGAELRACGVAGHPCVSVPLPPRFELGQVAREDCVLTSKELEFVVPQLMGLLRSAIPPNNAMRRQIAGALNAAGYTEESMISRVASVYRRAVERH